MSINVALNAFVLSAICGHVLCFPVYKKPDYVPRPAVPEPWLPIYRHPPITADCSGGMPCYPNVRPAFRDYKCKYPNCETFGDYADYNHGKHFTDPDDAPDHHHKHHNKHRPKNWNPEHIVGENVYRAPDGTLISPGSDRWVVGYGDGGPDQGYLGPPQPAPRGFPPPAEPVDTQWGGYFPNWGPHVQQLPAQPIALPFQSDAPDNYEVAQGGYWHPLVETNQ